MNNSQNRSRLIIGGILVLVGIFLLFGEFVDAVFNIRIGHYTWPFTILVPGLALYLLAFITEDNASRALVVIGSIISATGILLFMQNLTGWWASWAYAWAFIFPTSVGLGQMLFGALRQKDELLREGWGLTRVGLIILLVGVVFFELLIGISGFRFFGLRGYCFPAALIVFGLILVLRYLLPGRRTVQGNPTGTPPAAPHVEQAVVSSEPAPAPEARTDSTGAVTWEAAPEEKTE